MPIVQKQLAEVLTVARASAGTVFDAAGNLVTVPANQPRFDYDPVTKAFKGLLVEEQRTNLSPGGWSMYNAAKVGMEALTKVDGLSVGSATRFQITIDGFCDGTVAAVVSVAPGSTYTWSYYVRSNRGVPAQAVRDTSNNAWLPFTFSQTTGPRGFVRYAFVFTVPAGCTQVSLKAWYAHALTGDFFELDGPQLEVGAFPTSYIPTTNVAVTRAADVVQVVDGLWRGNSAHTLYVEASRPQLSYGVFATLKSGNTLLFLESGFADPSILRASLTVNGAGGPIALSYGAVAGQAYKMAVTAAPGRVAYARDGVVVGSAAAAQVPGVPSLVIGSVGASGFLNGHIRQVQYTDRVLSDADLVAVSQKGLAA